MPLQLLLLLLFVLPLCLLQFALLPVCLLPLMRLLLTSTALVSGLRVSTRAQAPQPPLRACMNTNRRGTHQQRLQKVTVVDMGA